MTHSPACLASPHFCICGASRNIGHPDRDTPAMPQLTYAPENAHLTRPELSPANSIGLLTAQRNMWQDLAQFYRNSTLFFGAIALIALSLATAFKTGVL